MTKLLKAEKKKKKKCTHHLQNASTLFDPLAGLRFLASLTRTMRAPLTLALAPPGPPNRLEEEEEALPTDEDGMNLSATMISPR